MTDPYYADDHVTLWHGDCLEIDAWLTADVLVTDPPYGIGYRKGNNRARGSWKGFTSDGIANDHDTSTRDAALMLWGDRPGVVFGSFYAPAPIRLRHVAVWEKPANAGVIGATTGFRRDVEAVYLTGSWPQANVTRGSVLRNDAGSSADPAKDTGHSHAKPGWLMEQLIDAAPPGVIADPFAGSGSTLVAARNLGRSAIGVELEERYCETVARRLAQGVLL